MFYGRYVMRHRYGDLHCTKYIFLTTPSYVAFISALLTSDASLTLQAYLTEDASLIYKMLQFLLEVLY